MFALDLSVARIVHYAYNAPTIDFPELAVPAASQYVNRALPTTELFAAAGTVDHLAYGELSRGTFHICRLMPNDSPGGASIGSEVDFKVVVEDEGFIGTLGFTGFNQIIGGIEFEVARSPEEVRSIGMSREGLTEMPMSLEAFREACDSELLCVDSPLPELFALAIEALERNVT